MIHLYVWFRPPNGAPFRVGELLVSEPDKQWGGRLQGEFRYAREYLNRKDAIALDPLHLPLRSDPMDSARPQAGIHPVFEDSLPDAWGRAILCRRYNVPREEQHPAYLLRLLGSGALGALAYTRGKRWEEANQYAGLAELTQLAAAAERYELEPDAPMDDLMRLFMAASSPGGARPKVLVRDETYVHWIAKLASKRDLFDMVCVEAASLATAREAGIAVPEFRLEELGARTALLVRRFDVTGEGGRNHVVSMQTLLGAQHFYHLGYSDMADIVRKISDHPGLDLHLLFRQATFNAMLGNTDDHLKNFAMLHGAHGWRLTPAFDLLPDVNDNREHVLHFGYTGTRPSMAALHELGRNFGLSKQETARVIDEVLAAVEQFPDQCARFGVPEVDLEVLSRRLLSICDR